MPSLSKDQFLPTTELLRNDDRQKSVTRMPLLFHKTTSASHTTSASKVLVDETHEPSYPPRPIRELNSTLWDYSGCKKPVLLDRNDGNIILLFFILKYLCLVWPVSEGDSDVTLVSAGT